MYPLLHLAVRTCVCASTIQVDRATHEALSNLTALALCPRRTEVLSRMVQAAICNTNTICSLKTHAPPENSKHICPMRCRQSSKHMCFTCMLHVRPCTQEQTEVYDPDLLRCMALYLFRRALALYRNVPAHTC